MRRLLVVFVLAGLWAGGFSVSAEQPDPQSLGHLVPADKALSPEWMAALFGAEGRAPYAGDALETIGMPCGGICAGQLYVRGDGTLAQWWIANNSYGTAVWWTPLNAENGDVPVWHSTPLGNYRGAYRTYRPPSHVDQGFAIRVKPDGAEATVRTLDRDGFDAIRFFGEYPIATIEYDTNQGDPLPVEVTSEVYSPFIPLNARDSANPATIIRYRVRNTAEVPVEVSIAGWLQNLVCLELQGQVQATSRNRVLADDADTASVHFDLIEDEHPEPVERPVVVFEDFEDGTFDKWTLEGEAFRDGPLSGLPKPFRPITGYEGTYFAP